MGGAIYLVAQAVLDNPGLPTVEPNVQIPKIIAFLSGLIAAICLLIIVYQGVQFVLSSGEPTKVSKARTAILYALVGLAVSLSATVVSSVIIEKMSSVSDTSPIVEIVTTVTNIVSWAGGAIAVVFLVLSAFKFVSSGGNPDKIKSARNTILYSVIGLIVIVISRTLVLEVINRL